MYRNGEGGTPTANPSTFLDEAIVVATRVKPLLNDGVVAAAYEAGLHRGTVPAALAAAAAATPIHNAGVATKGVKTIQDAMKTVVSVDGSTVGIVNPGLNSTKEGLPVVGMAAAGSPAVPADSEATKRFTFNHVFDSDYRFSCPRSAAATTGTRPAEQEHIFDTVGKPAVLHALSGYNTCIMAYGQSGAGKTHTMIGNMAASDGNGSVPVAAAAGTPTSDLAGLTEGLIPRCLRELMARIAEAPSALFDFRVYVSFVEVYMEKVYCLLTLRDTLLGARGNNAAEAWDKENRGECDVAFYNGEVVATGARQELVATPEGAMRVLRECIGFRRTAGTLLNAQSSRSHAIFTVTIERSRVGGDGVELRSKMLFVDLAGSERVGQNEAKSSGPVSQQHLREATGINQSLLTLSRVTKALVEHQTPPYRESKLTLFLRDALGGSARTCIICCVQPQAQFYDESRSTLEWGSYVKEIKNPAIQIHRVGDAYLNRALAAEQRQRELLEELAALRQRMESMELSAALMDRSSAGAAGPAAVAADDAASPLFPGQAGGGRIGDDERLAMCDDGVVKAHTARPFLLLLNRYDCLEWQPCIFYLHSVTLIRIVPRQRSPSSIGGHWSPFGTPLLPVDDPCVTALDADCLRVAVGMPSTALAADVPELLMQLRLEQKTESLNPSDGAGIADAGGESLLPDNSSSNNNKSGCGPAGVWTMSVDTRCADPGMLPRIKVDGVELKGTPEAPKVVPRNAVLTIGDVQMRLVIAAAAYWGTAAGGDRRSSSPSMGRGGGGGQLSPSASCGAGGAMMMGAALLSPSTTAMGGLGGSLLSPSASGRWPGGNFSMSGVSGERRHTMPPLAPRPPGSLLLVSPRTAPGGGTDVQPLPATVLAAAMEQLGEFSAGLLHCAYDEFAALREGACEAGWHLALAAEQRDDDDDGGGGGGGDAAGGPTATTTTTLVGRSSTTARRPRRKSAAQLLAEQQLAAAEDDLARLRAQCDEATAVAEDCRGRLAEEHHHWEERAALDSRRRAELEHRNWDLATTIEITTENLTDLQRRFRETERELVEVTRRKDALELDREEGGHSMPQGAARGGQGGPLASPTTSRRGTAVADGHQPTAGTATAAGPLGLLRVDPAAAVSSVELSSPFAPPAATPHGFVRQSVYEEAASRLQGFVEAVPREQQRYRDRLKEIDTLKKQHAMLQSNYNELYRKAGVVERELHAKDVECAQWRSRALGAEELVMTTTASAVAGPKSPAPSATQSLLQFTPKGFSTHRPSNAGIGSTARRLI